MSSLLALTGNTYETPTAQDSIHSYLFLSQIRMASADLSPGTRLIVARNLMTGLSTAAVSITGKAQGSIEPYENMPFEPGM